MGAAGVVAVPLGGLVATAGVKYMGPTILMASLIEFIFGLLKGGKLINLVRYVRDYCMYVGLCFCPTRLLLAQAGGVVKAICSVDNIKYVR